MSNTHNALQSQETKSMWKRSELKVHKNGYYALAGAVLRQWKQDGCPECDMSSVKLWGGLLMQYIEQQNAYYKLHMDY